MKTFTDMQMRRALALVQKKRFLDHDAKKFLRDIKAGPKANFETIEGIVLDGVSKGLLKLHVQEGK